MRMLKNKVVKGLTEYMCCPVVPTDTSDRKPGYPYLSFKVITPLENKGGYSLIDKTVPSASDEFEYDIEVTRKEQAQFVMSVSAYSDDADCACELALKASDWFTFYGYDYLKGCNIVVVNVSNVGDRTTQIIDNYEYRYGFDVRFRVARMLTKIIETVEGFDSGGEIIKRKD